MGIRVLNVCVCVCVCFHRSLACAAMLMYDYPLKTDMETVRHMLVCVLPSCPDMFTMPFSKTDLRTHTVRSHTQTHRHTHKHPLRV